MGIFYRLVSDYLTSLINFPCTLLVLFHQASHIVSPTGSMETLYDERGAQYKLPIFTFSNPIELVGESVSEGAQASPVVAVALSANTSGKGLSNKSGTATPVVHAEPLQLKIRINPGTLIWM